MGSTKSVCCCGNRPIKIEEEEVAQTLIEIRINCYNIFRS